MTEKLFVGILNMSLTGSFAIAAVLLLRLFLRRLPRIFSYCLWAVVLFRLLCPISFTAIFSPFNALQPSFASHGRMEYISEDLSGFKPIAEIPGSEGAAIADVSPDRAQDSPDPDETSEKTQFTIGIASKIWLAGITVMLLYSVLSLIVLKQKLKSAAQEKDNIYLTDQVSTPFVIGILRPRIYLPCSLKEQEREYILMHEQIHIKRLDHIVKIVSFLTLCIHWFNPFVWAAFFLSGKDMEMSCDEAVIRKIGSEVKKQYSTSLLYMATGKRIVNGIPLAFGEGDTGSRIRNILRYRRPTIGILCLAALMCIAAAVVLLANPKSVEENPETDSPNVIYGVVTDLVMDPASDEVPRKLLVVPDYGELDIPQAETISTYFERDEQTLLAGDMVAVTFPPDAEISILETWPGRFSQSAESITVMWSGIDLQKLESDRFLLTFPAGVVPDSERAKASDPLSVYWEESENDAYLTYVPESETSRLLFTTPISAVEIHDDGLRYFTIEATKTEIQQLFSGFGFHIRFALETDDSDNNATDDPADVPGAAESTDTYRVYVRSVSRSANVIDIFSTRSPDFPYKDQESLAFAQDCVFKVNESMESEQYKTISPEDFADLVAAGPQDIGEPWLLTFKNDLIVEALLESPWAYYGITFDQFIPTDFYYENLISLEGEDAFDRYYTLADTQTLDISDREGREQIEVYTGNAGDGDSGIVLFKDADGNLLCTQDAHIARAGWNNIYLGEADGLAFIMNVYVEDRDDYGGYGYWVYRLDQDGAVRQIAGSRYDFTLGDGFYFEYDDDLFRQWADNMTGWLEKCHLILSTQEGEVRTEQVCEADKYNYETLNLRSRTN